MEFFATCPTGFEHLLADELRTLRVRHVRPLRGMVSFEGEERDALRACLWSRLASRIVAVLARCDAADADALYAGMAAIPWQEHLSSGSTFVVDAHGTNDKLKNTHFTALRAKDAIVDAMVAATRTRPNVSTHEPDLRVVVRIRRSTATIGIDLSGEALFKRGVVPHGRRSLRPDYAAAILAAGDWGTLCQTGSPALVTVGDAESITREATDIARDTAPGILRARWGFDGWAAHDAAAWDELIDEADARTETAQDATVLLISIASEKDVDALDMGTATDALLACDLSQIEDAAALADVTALCAHMLDAAPVPTTVAALAPGAQLDLALGMDATSVTATRLGSSDLTLRSFAAGTPRTERASVTLADGRSVPVLVAASDQFAARLAKVAKQRAKWARKEDVSCYRIYDADLPDYAVAIDLFQGAAGTRDAGRRWLNVSEYAAPKEIDPALAQARLADALSICGPVLDVTPADVHLHVRTRAKGGSQYAADARGNTHGSSHLIEEGGLVFEVDFEARHDCGIFLDHRDTRAMLREMAKQTRGSKRFLNLFAYTGTGTCYAADGGCKHTTTVDLSAPSLAIARRNMERNGFRGPEHEYVQADVLAWVSEQRHTRNRWDLVFCDVPTFSNSARMRTSAFDVQRDHAQLLIDVSRLLTREGVCVFSCNLRSFLPDLETLGRAHVELEDITQQTIPGDFSRTPKVHHTYLVRHTG